jgi:periplasmic protein CpxP/Spy
MKTNFSIIAAAAVIFACGLTTIKTFAADNSATTTPLRGHFFQRIAERLNLTDDQKAQIKTALSGEKEVLVPLLGKLHEARKNLRATIQSAAADETAVRAASAKVAAVEGDLAVERMKIFGKIAPVLTDEQRRQISEFEQRADDFADSFIARAGQEPGD